MKRAAIEIETLAMMMVALVSFVLIMTFVFRGIQEKLPTTAQDSVCVTSIAARGKFAVKNIIQDYVTGDYVPLPGLSKYPVPLLCSTHTVNNLEDLSNKRKSISKDQVLEVFTKEISNCWFRFNQGKYPHTIAGKEFLEFERGDNCFPCAVISAPDTTPLIREEEVIEHLQTHDINSKKIDSEDYKKSAYYYITQNNDVPGRLALFTDIEPSSSYTIYYSDLIGVGVNGIYLSKTNIIPYTDLSFWEAVKKSSEAAAPGGRAGFSVGSLAGGAILIKGAAAGSTALAAASASAAATTVAAETAALALYGTASAAQVAASATLTTIAAPILAPVLTTIAVVGGTIFIIGVVSGGISLTETYQEVKCTFTDCQCKVIYGIEGE